MEKPELNGTLPALSDLLGIIRRLRRPDGCPWDREQTPGSMVRFLAEESFEVADAVASGDPAAVCEELGDALFQLLFIVEIFAEQGVFDLAEVCRRIAAKMRRRHPHVFGGAAVSGSEEVRRNWQVIKQQEKQADARAGSCLDPVPAGLPALMRAHAVSERAARSRFDWDGLAGVMQKLEEELAEFREAIAREDPERRLSELGDVFFTLVNVARFCAVDPETALLLSTRKFERRFRAMEQIVRQSGREMPSVPQEEKDRIWERVKAP